MKRLIAASTVLLSGVAAFTFAQTQNQHAQQQGSQQSQMQMQLNKSEEQHFIKEASSDNNLEIRVGQLIEQKVQDQQIRQFAQRLVQDHQKAEQQLQQVAQQMGVSLSAQQLTPVDQAKLQDFEQKQGPQLEMAFAFCEVGDHHTDILMNEYVSQNAQDAQLKQYAQQQVPILREHLQLAEQCSERFVPEARTAGEHMRGMRNQLNQQQNQNSGTTGGATSGGSTGTGGAQR
jgi:putative membrane protein